ncbi:hypothetical protein [Kaistella jeonii]|uniref:Uncharacterized protein n=1 Tax=Kaistella jeonii TaxID=266749 RepID=A0A0C1F9J3_9FLAO|nr:hypothetical protein [Kaistella jeonii]KIA88573.1 hypothetical protein OA86_11180 [Kaistella jeonii]SFC21347.1 hypothetical protein SAMN05421876_10990 [Kaistella jeonii]VEI96949.1 Uncharacterised protein [Kaistella jeonii]
MKSKLKEIDVDFIGDRRPLTKKEEAKISAFIRELKAKEAILKSINIYKTLILILIVVFTLIVMYVFKFNN